MIQHIRKKSSSGFSILELSIIITILGVITYGTISAGLVQIEMANVKQTNHKLDKIENALTLYLKTYGYLPCPASGTLVSTNSNYGKDTATHSGKNDASSTGTLCAAANKTSTGTYPDVYIGMIPITTLGLPKEYALDAWGNRITYIVSRPCVAPDNWQTPSSQYINTYKCSLNGATTANTEATANSTSGGLIAIGYNTSTTWLTGNSRAAYITISHGYNGYGAYDKNGTKLTGSGGDAEKINGNLTAGGADTGSTAGSTTYYESPPDAGLTAANTFDDLVRWRTAAQLYYDATH